MLQLRVRAVNDNGSIGSNSRIIPTKEITYTTELNATATLDFSVSRNDWAPVQEPFLVRVEYSVNGGPFAPVPTNDLFISESNSDDSKDPDKIVSYTLVSYGSWLLAGAYVGTGPWQKDNERRINGDGAYKANAGQIMSYFIDESKSRGWLKHLNRNSFNSTKDSNGVNWTTGDKAEIAWRLETFYNTVLEQLSEQMYCDWSTTGNQLHLYRPGTLGTAKPDLVLGGPDYTRVPVKVDSSGWYTHVIGVSEAGRFHANNASAEARFGRRSISMSQTGVKDAATSQRMVNDLLAEGLDSKREEAYEWVPRQNTFYPFRDFRVGDHVTALSRGGTQIRRVISIIVTQGENAASVQVRAGEKIKSINIKNARKLASTSVGGVIGGSGGAFPTSPPLPTTQPMAPDGLSVQSNTSEWLNDGSAKSYVTLTWSPVTEGVDGSEVDIVEYEVWTRTPSTTRKRLTATNTNTIDLDNLAPGQETLVSVRAKTDRNVWGPFSLELTLTPQYPSSVVPKPPTGLTATSNVGGWVNGSPVATVQLSWAAVTESVDDEPVEVVEYEVWENDAPKQRVTTPGLKVDIPSGVSKEYRVRARSAFGVWGDLSAVPSTEVTGATPTLATLVPTKPTLTTGLGLVIATWNGNYTTTPTQAALGVRVEARVGTGSWKQQGAVLTTAGDQAVSVGSTGDTVEVRFVAVDRLNRVTGTSAVTTIVVSGVDLADLDQAIMDELTEIGDRATAAQTAAGTAQNTANAAKDDAAAAQARADAVLASSRVYSRDMSTVSDMVSISSPAPVAVDSPTAPGGKAFRKSGTGTGWWSDRRARRPFDPNALYRLSVMFRVVTPNTVAGGGNAYIGLNGFAADGTTYVNSTGAASSSSQHYLRNGAHTRTDGEWFTWVGYCRGQSTGNTSGMGGSPTNPLKLHKDVRWIEPMVITDYNAGDGVVEVGSIALDVVTQEGYQAILDAQTADGKAVAAQTKADQAFANAASAATAAGQAQTTADGKNRIWYLATTPSGTGHNKDDVWFDTANGMRMSFWNTTTNTWTLAQFGTGAIAALSITNALIANAAIDNAKIANVDAGKVTTGYLAAARIAANSLTVAKLLVGSFDELFQSPYLIGGNGETGMTSGTEYTATSNPLGLPMLELSGRDHYSAPGYQWSAKPGDEFVIEAVVKKLRGTASWALKVGQWNAAGGTPSGTNTGSPTATTPEMIEDLGGGWGRYRTVSKLTTHATITQSGLYVQISQGIAGQPALGETALAIAGVSVRRRNGGELIVDGAVKARHVEMETGFFDKLFGNEAMIGRIKTNHIDPAVGGQLSLSANESIVLIAGRQDAQDADLVQAQEAADAAQQAAVDAASAADAADAHAGIAAGAALVAQSRADEANERLTTHQAVFRVTPTGAVVATPDSAQELRLNPGYAALAQNGVEISRWEAGRMIVNEMVVSRAQIGAHQLEKYSSGRTIVRPI